MEKFTTIQIKDKSLIFRMNKYTANQSIIEGRKVYNFEIVETLIRTFLDKEGA